MVLPSLLFALAFRQGNPLLSSLLPTPPKPDQVVVRVNGEPIKASEIEAYLWDWRGADVTQDVITYRLIQAEAKKAGVKTTVPEIQKAYDERLKTLRAGMPPGTDFDQAMRAQGFPKSRLYLRVHTDLLLDALVLKNFSPAGYVRVSTLAYKPVSDAATEVSAAILRAQAAYDRVSKGGAWEAELDKSDDEGTLKTTGGLLGWRMVNAFPASTQQELRVAKPGFITKPAQAAGAIQVFRVEALGTSASGADLEELRKAFLVSGRQDLVQRLRSQAKIDRVYLPKT
ncbi:peptidylprolyl isomerase [Fimbriimonas ginsengisoli]|uniref:PpiC-type peptidyl-prolyl cis-trans isomerase n=1 Tax=Fimbriimonas ginsengisoli Gsoil 348 TaxID=661478 RepID=A0A068NSK7_FIMGI|nr:hypothetical protein [Fimbriimonas ginsengisoli]AIE86426.1 PpiC-type peptidyl-prolyl cis-trans isomerase [Fimbriimonas ginsengisoli Gsoil 348]